MEANGWTYVHFPSNLGFGKAHNYIFREFGQLCEFHLIVNPDITFDGPVVEEMLEFLSVIPEAGCVMPNVLYPTGQTQRLAKLLPDPIDLLVRRCPFNFRIFKSRTEIEIDIDNIEGSSFKVPFVSGCFLLFRSSVLRRVGFFDERYFMYAEDLDLSRRLWHEGFFPYFLRSVSVKHGYRKGSSINIRLFLVHVHSVLKYFWKWGYFDQRRRVINADFWAQFK